MVTGTADAGDGKTDTEASAIVAVVVSLVESVVDDRAKYLRKICPTYISDDVLQRDLAITRIAAADTIELLQIRGIMDQASHHG